MTKRIKKHTNFNQDDYNYLSAKGWTDKEIADRWDEEAKRGHGPCAWDGGEVAKAKLASVLGR